MDAREGPACCAALRIAADGEGIADKGTRRGGRKSCDFRYGDGAIWGLVWGYGILFGPAGFAALRDDCSPFWFGS